MFRKDNDKKWNRRKVTKLCRLPFHLSQSSRSQNLTKTLMPFLWCRKTNGIIKVPPKVFHLNVHFTGFNLSTDAKVKTMIRDSLVYYENEGI